MDVVYPLKGSGENYDELKFSLRTLRNLPHDQVHVIGGCPPWIRNVNHISTTSKRTKYQDSTNNVRLACESPAVSDPFILMNDDFFVLKPVTEVPTLNRGLLRDVERAYREKYGWSSYLDGMRATYRELKYQGYGDPLSFELHVPLVVHKSLMIEALDMGSDVSVWHKRTAYGAVAQLAGETIPDVKIYELNECVHSSSTFLSTSNHSFHSGKVGIQIRSRFPRRCSYEKGG